MPDAQPVATQQAVRVVSSRQGVPSAQKARSSSAFGFPKELSAGGEDSPGSIEGIRMSRHQEP
jgi:hypothetical protein